MTRYALDAPAIAREEGSTSTYEAESVAVATLQADALVADSPALAAKAAGRVPVVPLGPRSAPSAAKRLKGVRRSRDGREGAG